MEVKMMTRIFCLAISTWLVFCYVLGLYEPSRVFIVNLFFLMIAYQVFDIVEEILRNRLRKW